MGGAVGGGGKEGGVKEGKRIKRNKLLGVK